MHEFNNGKPLDEEEEFLRNRENKYEKGFGGLSDALKNLSDKMQTETSTGTMQQFDPQQLFGASTIFANVYNQLMRRGLI
jgi:hypothetical protein